MLLLAACADHAEITERTALQFEEAMFGGPFDSDLPRDGRLIKWVTPIRVQLSGIELEKHGPAIVALLRETSAITDVPLHINSTRAADTNFRVILSPRKGFPLRKDFAQCAAEIKERDGAIQSVTMIITKAHTGGEAGCVAHEIMHAFGFRYHSGNLRSALSPAHREADFTYWDKLILRMLYTGKLAPGMARHTVKPLLQPMIHASKGTDR